MAYSIRIKASAAKALRKLDRPTRVRLVARIDELAQSPHAGTLLKGDLSGLRRVRVGDYRIIYEVFERQVTVLVVRVAHRRDVYSNRS